MQRVEEQEKKHSSFTKTNFLIYRINQIYSRTTCISNYDEI